MRHQDNETGNSWRLFIAIELPAEIRHEIKQHIDRLRAELPKARASWVREQNLHLTLKFLGDIPIERVETVSRALQTAVVRTAQFEIDIHDPGSFPPHGKPSVLWIGIEDPSGNLSKLHDALENECERVGFARDARPFHPHLTIARLRDSPGVRNLGDLHKSTNFPAVRVKVRDVSLNRSELNSGGSRYTVVARRELRS